MMEIAVTSHSDLPSSNERLTLVRVEPQPDYIESSGRWHWPLPPHACFPGCCTAVVTASREWWEYAPSAAKPHPHAEGVRLRDDIWYWAVPTPVETTVPIPRRVRLLKDIFDDGQDHHPPGYCARKGEVVIVRTVRSLGVSHEGRTGEFIVRDGEFESMPPEEPTPPQGLKSIGFEPRGSQIALVMCFDSIENAQAARAKASDWIVRAPEKASGESRAEFERDRGFVRRCPKCGEELGPDGHHKHDEVPELL